MKGEKFVIFLVDGAEPFCVKAPWSIVFAYHEKLERGLGLIQHQGIITQISEPTEWCAPIVFTPKKVWTVLECV